MHYDARLRTLSNRMHSRGALMHRRLFGRRGDGWVSGTLLAAAVLALVPAVASAQLASAAYTAAEAEAGRVLYDQACAACHMPNLRGSFEAPELVGPTFQGGWSELEVEDLLEIISVTMPPGAGARWRRKSTPASSPTSCSRTATPPAPSRWAGSPRPPRGRPPPGSRWRSPPQPACRAARARCVPRPSGHRSPTRCCGTPTRRTG